MRIFSSLAILTLLIIPLSAQAAINVFACEPEWAFLAKELGGEDVETFTATTARQDPHYIRAKPSLIAAMRKAALVVCSGASLEVGWLPILLQKAGNADIQPGKPGFLYAADVLSLIEKPARLDRADGDIHPEGNPHVHLDPRNIARVARALQERLQDVDPENAKNYQARFREFFRKWQAAMARWEKEAAELKGTPVVVHHKSFSYLLSWLGMKEAGTLEPKPGIPPTTAHLETLLQKLKAKSARIILRTPYDPDDASEWLSEKTGAPAVVLPYTVGGDERSADLFGLFDRMLALLKEVKHAQP